MNIHIHPLTEEEAKASCGWVYPPPYDVYNEPDWDSVVAEESPLADPEKRQKEFFALYDEETYLGYFRLAEKDDYIMLGIGLKPEFCGKGLGTACVKEAILEYQRRRTELPLWLLVRPFNKRAIRCYEKAGFVPIGLAKATTYTTGETKFIVMAWEEA